MCALFCEACLYECTQGQPGKDVLSVPCDNQQVSKIPSSSHLSVNTDDSNFLEPADVGERASLQPDAHRRHDAW